MRNAFRNNEKLITEITGKLLRGNLQNSIVDHFLKKMSADSCLILSYHGINNNSEITTDNNILQANCTFDEFRIQLNVIKRYFNIVALKDIVQHISGETKVISGKPLAAITFDDGYKNIKEKVIPLLDTNKIPATLFITTGILERSIIPNFVKTEFILSNDKNIEGIAKYITGGDNFPKSAVRNSKERALQFLKADKKIKEKIFNDILSDRALTEYVNTNYMSKTDIKNISSSLFEIASHSHSHRDFSLLSQNDILYELKLSKYSLENITGKEITSFAVPFGGKRFFKNMNDSFFLECGYNSCCSTVFGVNKGKINQFMLKRIVVNNFDSAETFTLKVSGKLDFLAG